MYPFNAQAAIPLQITSTQVIPHSYHVFNLMSSSQHMCLPHMASLCESSSSIKYTTSATLPAHTKDVCAIIVAASTVCALSTAPKTGVRT